MTEIATEPRKTEKSDLIKLTSEIVAAYVAKNTLAVNQVPELIRTVHGSLAGLSRSGAPSAPETVEAGKPAVPVKKSITPEYIICLEDGKKLKMLKRHLRTVYNMTPEQYRAKWNLPADYPMTAPGYAAQRSAFAKKIGLGKSTEGKAEKKKAA
jgi:predicted transcriptional regulator